MKLEEIKKLAELARIEMTDDEMLAMAGDFDPILAYVGQIQKVVLKGEKGVLEGPNSALENVVKDDIATNNPGSNSEKITAEMPETQDGFLKVKQIL